MVCLFRRDGILRLFAGARERLAAASRKWVDSSPLSPWRRDLAKIHDLLRVGRNPEADKNVSESAGRGPV
jgi:hypothetical protein